MDDIKHNIPMNQRNFFKNLENYLGTPLYYFGSIKRYDYSPKNSDIDAILFTNNESSSISQLQNWFHVSKNDFKRVVNFLPGSKRMVRGYKLKYTNAKQNISSDILIYNIKDKELIKRHEKLRVDMPFYIVTIMMIIKFLHAQVGILSIPTYTYLKNIIMDIMDDGIYFWEKQTHTWKFVIFDIPKAELDPI